MKFMVIRKADADTEAGAMPEGTLIDDMTAYNERAVRAGIMRDGNGLLPSTRGARVSFRDGKPSVIDGPFAEAKELIAGYSILEMPSLADAVEWVKQWPASDGHGNVQLEIRQIITAEDLGFSEEQIARDAKLREAAATRQQ
jgi:hypothetical protein